MEGYLFRDESGAYVVGPKLPRLSSVTAHQIALRKLSRPVLQSLRDVTRETVNLGILVGQDVFYVDVVQSQNPFPMVSRVGTLRPLYCTAMGKALASTLPSLERERLLSSLHFHHFTPRTIMGISKLKDEFLRIQTQGYAVDDEEAALGTRCVSVSVGLCGGKLSAALSVSAPVAGMPRDEIPSFAKAVQNAAQMIVASVDGLGPHVNRAARNLTEYPF